MPLPKLQFYKDLPKVELHRHLEGSLRLQTMEELAVQFQLPISGNNTLRQFVQVQKNETYSMANFLSKFKTLRLFYLSPEVIARFAYEAVEDAARDGVRYMELLFTPAALAAARGYSLPEVMDWTAAAVQKANRALGIQTYLIASVNRHEDPSIAEKVASLAVERKDRGIIGLNLAGNESEFPADPFISIFRRVKESGLAVTIHAGEWNGAQNVRQAIEELNADRIGHGIRVLDDPRVVTLARERNTPFEVCLTSNYQTGAVQNIQTHPLIRMLEAGLNVTLNSDDPSISGITLSDEYALAASLPGITTSILSERILAAANATLLTENEKHKLVESLRQELTK